MYYRSRMATKQKSTANMVRVSLYVTRQEKAAVNKIAARTGVGFAEIVRRALDAYLMGNR